MRKIIFGNFAVDSNGNIINTKTGNIIKAKKNKTGYLQVNLYDPLIKSKRTQYIHILVAQNFIDSYDYTIDKIHFKDGNKQNCSLDNIELFRLVKVYP